MGGSWIEAILTPPLPPVDRRKSAKKVGKPKLPYASERGDIIPIESRANEIVVLRKRKKTKDTKTKDY
jgi:hypothetical protein